MNPERLGEGGGGRVRLSFEFMFFRPELLGAHKTGDFGFHKRRAFLQELKTVRF
jgi:hypothetical protein